MHVFVYEWITGGGLVEQAGRLPESLLAEGTAMTAALTADLLAIAGCRVTRLADHRLSEPLAERERVIEVHSESHRRAEFAVAAAEADYTVVIAPEFDRILMRSFRAALEAGARPLGGSAEFIALASDKQRTAGRLAAAGVSTPEAVLVPADAERLPHDFRYPGVLKPLDGAGSQHTLLVEGPQDEPPPYPWPRRLERYCPGRAASAAFLCGPAGAVALPPCWQHQSTDGRFAYRGGAVIDDPALAARAVALAERALAALPAAYGYAGVDLVLGDAADGSDDAAIEINPRLTTSYVGLRAAVEGNLAEAMIAVHRGESTTMRPLELSVEFTAEGGVTTKPRLQATAAGEGA